MMVTRKMGILMMMMIMTTTTKSMVMTTFLQQREGWGGGVNALHLFLDFPSQTQPLGDKALKIKA